MYSLYLGGKKQDCKCLVMADLIAHAWSFFPFQMHCASEARNTVRLQNCPERNGAFCRRENMTFARTQFESKKQTKKRSVQCWEIGNVFVLSVGGSDN